MTTPLLDCIEIETAPNPTVAVIWLHGLGADGNDFVPVVQELDLSGCPPIRFVFPNAPTMPVTIKIIAKTSGSDPARDARGIAAILHRR